MNKFSTMRLSTKLGLAFGLLIALLLVLVLVDNRNMKNMKAKTEQVFEVNHAAGSASQAMIVAADRMRVAYRDMVLAREPAVYVRSQGLYQKARAQYGEAEAALARVNGKRWIGEAEQACLARIREAQERAFPAIDHLMDLMARPGKEGAADFILGTLRPIYGEWMSALDELGVQLERENGVVAAELAAAQEWAQRLHGGDERIDRPEQ